MSPLSPSPLDLKGSWRVVSLGCAWPKPCWQAWRSTAAEAWLQPLPDGNVLWLWGGRSIGGSGCRGVPRAGGSQPPSLPGSGHCGCHRHTDCRVSSADPGCPEGSGVFPSGGIAECSLDTSSLPRKSLQGPRLLRRARVSSQAQGRMQTEGCATEPLEGELALQSLPPALLPYCNGWPRHVAT